MNATALNAEAVFFWSALVIIFIAVMAVRIRMKMKKSAQLQRYEEENRIFAKEKDQRVFDHQLTHGRLVFGWLVEALKQYEDVGIKIFKVEHNQDPENKLDSFSIIIEREDSYVMRGVVPILQLSFNFVRYPVPYHGHIHYGSYGPDILFWVGDHSPFNGLDSLVLKVVREEAERLRGTSTTESLENSNR